jgi:hypothetical protein
MISERRFRPSTACRKTSTVRRCDGGVGRTQLDLVVCDLTQRAGRKVLAIGEAKAGFEPVGVDELERLDAIWLKVRIDG